MKVELTKTQCENIAEFIEFNLLSVIKDDDSIDNIFWVEDMIAAMRVLERAAKEGDEVWAD